MLRYEAKQYIKSGRILGMFSCREDHPQRLHCHDFIELVYITSGSAFCHVFARSVGMSPGEYRSKNQPLPR